MLKMVPPRPKYVTIYHTTTPCLLLLLIMGVPYVSNNDTSESASLVSSKCYVNIKGIEREGPTTALASEERLKEWIWEHHKEKFLESMSTQRLSRSGATRQSGSGSGSEAISSK